MSSWALWRFQTAEFWGAGLCVLEKCCVPCRVVLFPIGSCVVLYEIICIVLYCISRFFFSQLHLITRQKRRCIVRHESQRPLPASRWDSPVVDEQKDVKDESIDTQTKCVNR